MSDKKMQGRFTIQFNLNDPQQKKVSDCLDEQGRRKTQFITNAVLYYLDGDKTQRTATSSLLSDSTLEMLLMKMLAKVAADGSEMRESEAALRQGSRVNGKSNDISAQYADEPDYSALTGSLMELDKM